MPAAAGAILRLLGHVLATIVGTAGGFVAGTAGSIATTLGTALVVIAFFFLLRVLFMLVRAYVSILLLIIFGPLVITFGAATPGSNAISAWFKNLLANILVFPATGLIIGLGAVISTRIVQAQQAGQQIWTPPLLGTEPTFLAGMIALGLLMVIPEIDGLIKGALGVKGIDIMPRDVGPQLQRGGQEFTRRFPERVGEWRNETVTAHPALTRILGAPRP